MHLSIQNKLTLLITVLIGIILSCSYFYLENNLKNFIFQRIESNLSHQLKLSRTSMAKMYHVNMSLDEFDDIADIIGEDLDIRATIIGFDGKVIGDSELTVSQVKKVENHFHRPEIQQALQLNSIGESRRFSSTLKQDMIYMAIPFSLSDQKGFVRLAVPLSDIKLVENRIRGILLFSLLIACAFAIAVGVIVSLWISRPIKEISTIAQNIAKGDFSQRSNISTHDELQDLSGAVNHMSDQIRLRIAEVETGRSKLEAVFSSMFEGVVVFDREGGIVLMNQTLKNLLCISVDPIGLKMLEVIRDLDIQSIAEKSLTLKGGVESKEVILTYPIKKVLLVHAAPVLVEEDMDGAVLVFHDITDLRHLEQVRKDFVANVSHELRTPVSTIKGYAETLLDGALDDKDNAKDFLEIIKTDADRLDSLINDLLDLARIESGNIKVNPVPVNIKTMVDSVFYSLKSQCKQNQIQLINQIDDEFSKVLADEIGINQVLTNLITNSVKYNNLQGSVIVSAKDKGDDVEVMIEDTGIGIPEEDVARIFERFYRVDKAHSRELGGTGLGLSIVKHILQAHQSDIFVKSQVGKGSTFQFFLKRYKG